MLFGNVLGKSCEEHVESCIVGEEKSDKNLVEAEIEKKPGKHEYFSHISKCNPPDVSLMPVSSDETKADPKTFSERCPPKWLEQDGRTEGCNACIQPKLHGREVCENPHVDWLKQRRRCPKA